MTGPDLDRIGWAITDLQQCLARLGMNASIRIQLRDGDLAALAEAAGKAGSRWTSGRGRDGTIRLAEAVFSGGAS